MLENLQYNDLLTRLTKDTLELVDSGVNTPILIIDNVNNFLINETAKSFLQELQGYAKEDAVRFIIYIQYM
jgi:hypothetical protein